MVLLVIIAAVFRTVPLWAILCREIRWQNLLAPSPG
jgi:hypothetical protein